MIDGFAAATGDDQWIHVDPERAKETPFGGTIAHGLYTLSLGPKLSYEMFTVDGIAFGINYGYRRSASRRRCRSTRRCACARRSPSVEDVSGGVQITVTQTFEREGEEKPVCVAESLARLYPGG